LATLDISTPEIAYALFRNSTLRDGALVDFDEIKIGDWVNPRIYLTVGDAELTAPFMEAFLSTQNALYRIVAQVRHNSSDIRKLSPEELETYRLRVKVTSGSTNVFEAVGDALVEIAKGAVDKLTPNQIIALIAGGAILLSGGYGFSAYLEHRVEIRREELKADVRIKELESANFATREQAETTRHVADQMAKMGGAFAQAVESSNEANAALLRAATTVPETTVNGVHITKSEAELLSRNRRRSSDEKIMEKEVRVIDINTSDNHMTTVVIDGYGDTPLRVSFADRMVQERDLNKLHASLKNRVPVRIKLNVKRVGGEIRSAEILRVVTPRKRG
jgi:hypothetical protein